MKRHVPLCALAAMLLAFPELSPQARATAVDAELVEKENEVDSQLGAQPWQAAEVGLKLANGDKVRTGALSRAVLRLGDRSMMRLDQITVTEIGQLSAARQRPTIKVNEGGIYYFSRERKPELEITTRAANGALHGTQLAVRVAPAGKTLLTVLEGEVEFYNPFGKVTLHSGEQGEAEIGKAPRKTAVINATNVVQWALYYPAVLDPRELGLRATEEAPIATSLAAYRNGDLLGALENYPRNYKPQTDAARLYRAAVVLAVGQVEEARQALANVPANASGRRAIEQMIAAVTFRDWRRGEREPQTSGEWMAESYYLQSKDQLAGALQAARRATERSPEFGYAWTRVGEMEFSFGRTRKSLEALGRGLQLTPRNAQAHALRGFLLSAQNQIGGAREAFNRAIDLDGALGNAWLGRGLTFLREGHDEQGRSDLQVAATVEPNRSLLHAYLGKAFSQVGDTVSARRDLRRAAELDPRDPTPWLYSAIENKQENRYNEAVRDLETSLSFNENRRVYRSRFLLDQDRAVRSANLAAIYQNNGMPEVAVRAATQAVDSDYASAGAHLFLANAFNAQRDPIRILLRYETSWFNELLIANLLSPVGGGPLSQYVSQHEYSKLFEADRVGFSSVTDYYSYGELRQTASQFGMLGNLSYALDAEYLYDNGQRPNNGISRFEGYATFKLQLGPQDTAFLQVKFQDFRAGDLFQRYDPRIVDRDFSARTFDFHEQQDPGLLLLGWHHEWDPGIHTVFLGGRLANTQTLSARRTSQFVVERDVTDEFGTNFTPPDSFNPDRPLEAREVLNTLQKLTGQGNISGLGSDLFSFDRQASFEIYSAELNQILTLGPKTLVFGGRFQTGDFETRQLLDKSVLGSDVDQAAIGREFFRDPAADQDFTTKFERYSLYAYDFWRVAPWLSLIGGVSYDHMRYPENFRSPPINDREAEAEKLSPKAGFVLQPHRSLVLRGAYTRSLSGVSFDENVRLEPTQIAGFTQASRTFISENVIGSVAGAEYETWGLSIEQKLPTSIYWGAEYSVTKQHLDRTIGAFDVIRTDNFPEVFGVLPSGLDQKLAYREDVLGISLNQLVGDRWSFGIRYRYAKSRLQSSYGSLKDAVADLEARGSRTDPVVLASLKRNADTQQSSSLHQISLFALYNHPSGFFARAETNWFSQENDGFPRDAIHPSADPRPGDDFWQFNVFAGWRFARNQCEVSVGFLNITGTDYRLEPLNYYTELPRDRTLFTRVKIAF